jgi:hypothetical protein
MTIHQCMRAIVILPNLDAIGQAVDQLVLSGFPLAQIFLLGRDRRISMWAGHDAFAAVPMKELLHQANLDTVTGSNSNLQRGFMVGNLTGGLTGLLVGLGLCAIPGVGQVVLGSALIYLLSSIGLGTLTGGAIGAIVGQNISDRLAKNYASQVTQGNYLLVVSGSEAEIFRAEHILSMRGIQTQS